jgi:glycosyltransferase involved in cell wall biosynthesis
MSGRDWIQPHRLSEASGRTAPRVSVVIPCYNEVGAIRDTLEHLHARLQDFVDHELIVVDDGSTDGSAAVLDAMAAADPRLHVVHHPRNAGYGAALKSGIRRARAELVAITDADGTYPNERLPELIALAEDADMVVGARVGDDVNVPFLRRLPKWLLTRFASSVARRPIPDINSGMRVMRRSVVQEFLGILPDTFSFTTTITLAMLLNRYEVRYVPISYSPRVGASKINPVKDTIRFFGLVLRTGVYFAPLRVFLPVVALLAVAAFASLGYDVFVERNLTDKTTLLFLFVMNTFLFALLADMIDKRSGR